MITPKREIAQRWAKRAGLQRLFLAEISNEANGGVRPASLSSTIDSLVQMPGDILAEIVGDPDDVADTLIALLMIRDLLPGRTEVEWLIETKEKVDAVHLAIERTS